MNRNEGIGIEGTSDRSDRAVVNGASQAVSAVPASIPSAVLVDGFELEEWWAKSGIRMLKFIKADGHFETTVWVNFSGEEFGWGEDRLTATLHAKVYERKVMFAAVERDDELWAKVSDIKPAVPQGIRPNPVISTAKDSGDE